MSCLDAGSPISIPFPTFSTHLLPTFPKQTQCETSTNTVRPSRDMGGHLHSCSGLELKELRLVNKTFNECAIPLLFEHACFSVTEDNIANLKQLLDCKELSRHVKTLWIDCAVFDADTSLRVYVTSADYQLELAIADGQHLELKAFMSITEMLVDSLKYHEPDPSITMSVEEKLLQKNIMAYYIESHKKYLSMAEF